MDNEVIINLTQHEPTPEQAKAGVTSANEHVKELLTFTEKPTTIELISRATKLAYIAREMCDKLGTSDVLIGGAPFFMRPLEYALEAAGMQPRYAFSKRVSVEDELPDGTVLKKNIFKHDGFIIIDILKV